MRQPGKLFIVLSAIVLLNIVLLNTVNPGILADSPTDTLPELAACLACHGPGAKGNRALKAPSLSNLDPVYLSRQLRYFRDGIRGADMADVEGFQMRAAVQGLDDETIEKLARSLSALPNINAEVYLRGDADKGKAYYGHLCGACHGPAGVGIKSLGAPALAGLDDWYMDSQLKKFQAGIRGGSGNDRYGAQMVFIMQRLQRDEGILDIIAYLRDLDVETK